MSVSRPAIDQPRYLGVIPVIARIAMTYFAVVAVALVADVLMGYGATFRRWPAFAAQAVLALVLGSVVVRGELQRIQQAGRPAGSASSGTGSPLPTALLAAGVLAGGFFPDSPGYSRRAPEPFMRTLLAIGPAAIAAWLVVRAAAPRPVATSTPSTAGRQEPPLAGTAREAATKALDMLTACDEALAGVDRRASDGDPPTRADFERLWATLEGYEVHLRALPIGHPVSNALQDSMVAYIDAGTLSGLALGAHAAMDHSPESGARFIEEVATRRGVPGTDAAQLAPVARTAAQTKRATAAELLQATRFTGTLT